MLYYNSDNNACCSAVNAQNFETRQHNTVKISTFLYKRNLYSYFYLDIFICIYSGRSNIDQIATITFRLTITITFRYTTCCAANVYMFVCILIGAPIVPLRLAKAATHSAWTFAPHSIMDVNGWS